MEELVTVDCGLWKFQTPRNSARAKWGKEYEPTKVRFFEKYIKPGDAFVDVGACEGFFTLMAAQFTGSEGYIVAFEPEQENFDLLQHNVEASSYFDRIETVRLAVAGGTSYKKLYRGVNPGMHSLVPGLKHRSKEKFDMVSTAALDLFPFHRTPNGMKIDVEGVELSVLYGAYDLLRIPELRYIAIDVHPSLSPFGQHIGTEVGRIIREAGFAVVQYPGQGNEVFGVKE